MRQLYNSNGEFVGIEHFQTVQTVSNTNTNGGENKIFCYVFVKDGIEMLFDYNGEYLAELMDFEDGSTRVVRNTTRYERRNSIRIKSQEQCVIQRILLDSDLFQGSFNPPISLIPNFEESYSGYSKFNCSEIETLRRIL